MRIDRGQSKLTKATQAAILAAKRDNTRSSIRQILSHPQARLLDVGCGNGNYLEFARRAGWQVQGLDFVGIICWKLSFKIFAIASTALQRVPCGVRAGRSCSRRGWG
jgi:SAM-dependent methyltransferase